VQGGGELLDALDRGEVDLATLPADVLPEEFRGMTKEQREARVAAKRKERKGLQERLDKLLAARAEHVAAERRRLAADGKADAFDAEVAKTVRDQAGRKGIDYAR
jgi:hypothetical protein